jgi:hypothetical protein
MNNKRGQGLSTNAIILIILGIFVLVILVVGFTLGWDVIAPWISKENVDDVVKGCAISCNTQSEYGFCTQTRTLVDSDKNEYKNISCFALTQVPETQKYKIGDCNIQCGEVNFKGDVTFVKGADPCINITSGSIFVVNKKVKTFMTC